MKDVLLLGAFLAGVTYAFMIMILLNIKLSLWIYEKVIYPTIAVYALSGWIFAFLNIWMILPWIGVIVFTICAMRDALSW